MKNLLIGCLALLLCLSCGRSSKRQDPFEGLTRMVDSTRQKEGKDSAACAPAETSLRPLEADELFDDFIFNYASDPSLQRQRTAFPLPCKREGRLAYISAEEWAHDSLFAGENLYTLLFDRERDMDLVADTALSSVQVEWMFLKTRELKRYHFNRHRGMWMLDSITSTRDHSPQGSFLPFFARFVADSIYQRKHVHSPLSYVTIDPDDDFSILETTLDVEQWFAFRPQMSSDRLSNICYGQRNDPRSTTKILKVNGIGNGYSITFYFRCMSGEWELYKYEDTSI